MRQRTFAFGKDTEFTEVLAGVAESADYTSARARLLVVFEPDCEPDRCAPKIMQMTSSLPGAHICGMTSMGTGGENAHAPSATMCTLLTFENSDIAVFSYDCHDMTPDQAGELFSAELDRIDSVRGVLFMSSCAQLQPTPFIERIVQDHPRVPIFGAQAGTSVFEDDHSTIMVDGAFYDRGIMAIALCGSDLHVETNYNMGFRPIGREFMITHCDGTGLVNAIDSLPATSIYEHYLAVKPDRFFHDNVCTFPLLERRDDILLPRVPLDFAPDGSLRFSMKIPAQTTVTLSYAKPEYLLTETLDSANRMLRFAPQAVLMFNCMNRRIFMGDAHADRELDYYRRACKSACWGYGYGEVLRTARGGGIMNSALVAIGLREGKASADTWETIVDPEFEEAENAPTPLLDRFVAFLEATTSELRDTIEGLSLLAQRDTLTGLYNRRYMDDLIAYELSRLEKDDRLVLLMYDIDHFKRVNDTYGHDVGDTVLKAVTKRVEDTIRTNDVLSRWGGEEFLLLFTRAKPELALELAERVRNSVAKEEFDTVGRITISVGVTLGTHEDTPESLFNRVDGALYEAKHSGRNRVCYR